MPVFKYTARNMRGEILQGKMDVETKEAIISKLQKKGLIVTKIEEESVPFWKKEIRIFKPKVQEKDLVVFSRLLATLINAGVPLDQCLDSLGQQFDNPTMKSIINQLKTDVESGDSLSSALAKNPNVFSKLYTSLVASGEAAGNLDEIMSRLAKYVESSAALKRKVIGAMTYPLVLMGVSLLIVSGLILFVIPKFKEIFADFGGELPILTKTLLGISDFFISVLTEPMYAFLTLLIAGFLVFFLYSYLRSEKGRALLDSILLRLPVFGDLFAKVAIAKFTETMGTLLASGVQVVDSFDIVAATSGNVVVEKQIVRAKDQVKEGVRIADALGQSAIFPPMVIQMIAIGEQSGALDEMLGKIAVFYNDEVEIITSTLAELINPVMIIFMGIGLGFVMLSLFLPMFQLASITR
jgi:type IV pilus assembly protein PilC